MPKAGRKKTAKKNAAAKVKKKQRTQCHFISNTHWDREWRYSTQRTRYALCYLMDMLLDIFKKEKDFKYFHMDSQTPVLALRTISSAQESLFGFAHKGPRSDHDAGLLLPGSEMRDMVRRANTGVWESM